MLAVAAGALGTQTHSSVTLAHLTYLASIACRTSSLSAGAPVHCTSAVGLQHLAASKDRRVSPAPACGMPPAAPAMALMRWKSSGLMFFIMPAAIFIISGEKFMPCA